ncbi:hypothetical protein HED48_11385 [Ochrobactrum intermedium]|nr:hypothetical protein [Brucella intermedia]
MKQTGAPTACHEPHILSETVSHFSDARQRAGHIHNASGICGSNSPPLYTPEKQNFVPCFSVPAFNFLLQMQGITVANELPEQAMGKRRQVIKNQPRRGSRLA